MDFSDKQGVVTGGGRGMGLEVVKKIVGGGGSVVILERDEETGNAGLEEVSGLPGQAVLKVGDVSVEEDIVAAIEEAKERFGGFNFIHNNAGIQVEKPLHETSTEDWERVIRVNLTGVFWGCKHAVISMRETGGGSIVNTASVLSLMGDPFLSAYTASKHGVLGVTRAVAVDPDYAQAGIRCNCVCPGDMETPMIQQYFEATPDPAATRREMEAAYPAKQIGDPADVASVVAFLISDESKFVNGAAFTADGGLSVKVY